MDDQILTIKNKKQEEFLRKPTEAVLDLNDRKITELIEGMKEILIKRQGAGLAANQIGENKRIFIAQFEGKIYAFINPQIVKVSKKNVVLEEGCLSVPGIVGLVSRSQKITVQAFNELGKPIKIRAKDILARICQHEIDHLSGVLFIDKATKLFRVSTNEKTAD
ncbi:MAG TPA: peptide deformylase [Candidatus Paceibacterota bacterium]|nr:peptide deformylase [Candidatus Paceibacterota bacterium]